MRKGFVRLSDSPMFEFITDKANPFGGKCPFACSYCWVPGYVKRFSLKKYLGEAYLDGKVLRKSFGEGSFVFLSDMCDSCSPDKTDEMKQRVYNWCAGNPEAWFLELTKNPRRYFDFLHIFPRNLVLGATIESNLDYPTLSKAPTQFDRLYWMSQLADLKEKNDLFISIEPILDFDEERFDTDIYRIQPWGVALGYDNYSNNLLEPSPEKFWSLAEKLEGFTKVYLKTVPVEGMPEKYHIKEGVM